MDLAAFIPAAAGGIAGLEVSPKGVWPAKDLPAAAFPLGQPGESGEDGGWLTVWLAAWAPAWLTPAPPPAPTPAEPAHAKTKAATPEAAKQAPPGVEWAWLPVGFLEKTAPPAPLPPLPEAERAVPELPAPVVPRLAAEPLLGPTLGPPVEPTLEPPGGMSAETPVVAEGWVPAPAAPVALEPAPMARVVEPPPRPAPPVAVVTVGEKPEPVEKVEAPRAFEVEARWTGEGPQPSEPEPRLAAAPPASGVRAATFTPVLRPTPPPAEVAAPRPASAGEPALEKPATTPTVTPERQPSAAAPPEPGRAATAQPPPEKEPPAAPPEPAKASGETPEPEFRRAPAPERPVPERGAPKTPEPAPPAEPVRVERPVGRPGPGEAPVVEAPAGTRPSGETPGRERPAVQTQPAQVHGFEQAIERASLRQNGPASEVNLWMRPEHLGKVAVRLIERAGVVEVVLRAESAGARQLLSEALPSLVGSLDEKGWQVTRARAGSETALDWFAQGHGQRRQGEPGSSGGRRQHGQQRAIFYLDSGENEP